MKKKYIVDIDGTICHPTKDASYQDIGPLSQRIEKLNKLYDEGHTMVYFTARGMGRNLDNADKCYQDFYDLTLQQLENWGVKFHKLILGKPSGDIYIDDKAVNAEDFFG